MEKVKYGLIGYPLSHSFSSKYFTEKFKREGIQHASYINFPIDKIDLLPDLIKQNPDLRGLNVTIPYKQAVIRFMDDLSEGAEEIGAVNTIVIHPGGRLSGHNSDIFGFAQSLNNLIPKKFDSGALILGTGGASKAVEYVCLKRDLPILFVSRDPKADQIHYRDVNRDVMADYKLIINTTPLGMHPHRDNLPDLPYEALEPDIYLFDLIYNPPRTLFLQRGEERGCQTMNGMEMLIFQAEESWQIWNANRSI